MHHLARMSNSHQPVYSFFPENLLQMTFAVLLSIAEINSTNINTGMHIYTRAQTTISGCLTTMKNKFQVDFQDFPVAFLSFSGVSQYRINTRRQ